MKYALVEIYNINKKNTNIVWEHLCKIIDKNKFEILYYRCQPGKFDDFPWTKWESYTEIIMKKRNVIVKKIYNQTEFIKKYFDILLK